MVLDIQMAQTKVFFDFTLIKYRGQFVNERTVTPCRNESNLQIYETFRLYLIVLIQLTYSSGISQCLNP